MFFFPVSFIIVSCDLKMILALVSNHSVLMKKKENGTSRIKKPWPTKDAMSQIYTQKLWGDNQTRFYSGIGSHHPEIIDPYIDAVSSFLNSFKTPLVVCDLGCGDFNVGEKLVPYTKKYVAIDIVTELIEHHAATFNDAHLEFHCLDIAIDDIPDGDCAIVRQVLQHLSNAEIQSILSKLAAFKYVILTEHIPEGDFNPNVDIISGQGTRLKKQSGVNLMAPPFNFTVQEEQRLLSIRLDDGKGLIATTLYKV